MQLQLPFDTALVINKTSLRHDYPEVWERFQNKTILRFGRSAGARVYTQLGLRDLCTIRDYLELWLDEQDLIPADLRDPEDKKVYVVVRSSVVVIDQAIRRASQEAPC